MNKKQEAALDTIINFILHFTSDVDEQERMIDVAYDYVEHDHVLTEEYEGQP